MRKLNLDSPSDHPVTHKKKKLKKRYVLLTVVLAFFIGLSVVFFSGSNHSVVQYVLSTAGATTGPKISQDAGRTNILLFGIGGGKHEGPNLTDSIIIASYNYDNERVTMFSVPRDLWVDSIRGKVNTVYQIGINRGNALDFSKQTYSELMGIPIHYVVRIDFSGFEQAIDEVGGIDLTVPKTFDDYMYPIAGKENDLCGLREKEVELSEEDAKKYSLATGKQKVFVDAGEQIATGEAMFACRFEHLHFNAGATHMDGATALKFVRSRHGLNGEGSDFARSRRQQLVIEAFRTKALSLSTLANPVKVSGLISSLGKSLDTDIPLNLYLDFYGLSKNIKSVNSIVIGDLGGGKTFLETPLPAKYGGAYVVVPPNGDFNILRQFVKDKLALDATASATLVHSMTTSPKR